MTEATPSAVALPGALDDLTRDWLSSALSRAFPDVIVTTLDIHPSIIGTGTKVPVTVSYNDAGRDAGLPERLVLKGTFGGHEFSEILLNLQLREARFYRDVAPTLAINLPRCYFADLDEERQRSVVILEDMRERGVVFGAMQEPVDPGIVADLLGQLAALHAATWESPRRTPFGTWPDWIPGLLQEGYWTREAWAACLEQPYAAPVPAGIHDFDDLVRALTAMWDANRASPQCLVHGDPHLGNTFRDVAGRPGLLDWQMSMGGPYATDFSELLLSALTPEDRRANERDLLHHYLDALTIAGTAAPSFDEAWLSYRQNSLYPVMWVTIPDVMQTTEVTALATERASAAAKDLDALGSLGLS
jgi:aminoglycoside phosphotransferase (APT) family kinase protein